MRSLLALSVLVLALAAAALPGNPSAAQGVDTSAACSPEARRLASEAWAAQPMNVRKNTGDPERAEALYKAALDDSPRCLRALRLLTVLLARGERYARAYEYNELLLTHYPDDEVGLDQKAKLLADWKADHAQALVVQRRVLDLAGPGNGSAYYGMARIYALMNRRDEALRYLRLAMSISRNWGSAANAQADDAFVTLRQDPRFWDLVRE
jgi:tetratricopeptide (TPR) repeat protein